MKILILIDSLAKEEGFNRIDITSKVGFLAEIFDSTFLSSNKMVTA